MIELVNQSINILLLNFSGDENEFSEIHKKITHGLSLNMGNINISTFYLNSLLTIKI